MWLLSTIVVCLVAVALFFHIRDNITASRVLRHTIRVNLSILKSELQELFQVAQESQASQAVSDAKALLRSAATTARLTELRIDKASKRKLETMLTKAFQAMNRSTRARHLLNACSAD